GAPTAATLLDYIPRRHRVQLGPGAGPGARAVHGADVATARAQRGEVYADPAAARHDLHDQLEVVEDAGTAVLRAGHDEAVVERYSVARAGSGEDAAGGHELEVLHRGLEPLRPSALQRGRRLRRRDGPSHPPPHRYRAALERRAIGGFESVAIQEHALLDRIEGRLGLVAVGCGGVQLRGHALVRGAVTCPAAGHSVRWPCLTSQRAKRSRFCCWLVSGTSRKPPRSERILRATSRSASRGGKTRARRQRTALVGPTLQKSVMWCPRCVGQTLRTTSCSSPSVGGCRRTVAYRMRRR